MDGRGAGVCGSWWRVKRGKKGGGKAECDQNLMIYNWLVPRSGEEDTRDKKTENIIQPHCSGLIKHRFAQIQTSQLYSKPIISFS